MLEARVFPVRVSAPWRRARAGVVSWRHPPTSPASKTHRRWTRLRSHWIEVKHCKIISLKWSNHNKKGKIDIRWKSIGRELSLTKWCHHPLALPTYSIFVKVYGYICDVTMDHLVLLHPSPGPGSGGVLQPVQQSPGGGLVPPPGGRYESLARALLLRPLLTRARTQTLHNEHGN